MSTRIWSADAGYVTVGLTTPLGIEHEVAVRAEGTTWVPTTVEVQLAECIVPAAAQRMNEARPGSRLEPHPVTAAKTEAPVRESRRRKGVPQPKPFTPRTILVKRRAEGLVYSTGSTKAKLGDAA